MTMTTALPRPLPRSRTSPTLLPFCSTHWWWRWQCFRRSRQGRRSRPVGRGARCWRRSSGGDSSPPPGSSSPASPFRGGRPTSGLRPCLCRRIRISRTNTGTRRRAASSLPPALTSPRQCPRRALQVWGSQAAREFTFGAGAPAERPCGSQVVVAALVVGTLCLGRPVTGQSWEDDPHQLGTTTGAVAVVLRSHRPERPEGSVSAAGCRITSRGSELGQGAAKVKA